ncbi:hypothetical protein CRUP_023153 [Coryphaenoides rupestris]|nr:hypothetical protein CRUP_023153 [Coryphaenoides rupestris]
MRLVSQVLTWVMVVVPVLGWIPPLLVLDDVPDNFDLKDRRYRRDTVNITAEEEGSGIDMPVFIDPGKYRDRPR